jgi:hypothetical protein
MLQCVKVSGNCGHTSNCLATKHITHVVSSIVALTREEVIIVGMSKKERANIQHKVQREITTNAHKQAVM